MLDGGAELLRRVLDDLDIVGAERRKYKWGLELFESCISDIKELPSAEPRKKGTYTESGENDEWYCWYATCNECGRDWMGSRNFCPNCGCQMNGGEEE